MSATTTLPDLPRTVPVRLCLALSCELSPARSDVSFERLRETIAQLELTEYVLSETDPRPLVHLTQSAPRVTTWP